MHRLLNKPVSAKQIVYLCAFTAALIAQACEFDSRDDNFHPVQKAPAEIRLGIDLAGVNPYDTIYAYNYTCFQYSIDAEAREVIAQQFFMDGKEVNTDPINGYACVEATAADNQVHDLSVSMIVRSGTGSLADYAGMENYLGEFSFKVKVLDDEFEEMQLISAPDENKRLKLNWKKPAGYGDISGYEVYSGNELLATISDPNTTSWIDADYAYGYKDYQVKAQVTNSWNVTVNDAVAAPYTTMLPGDFSFERIAVNQIRVKWNNPNPYPCKYVLRHSYASAPVYIEEGVTEAIIPAGDFPLTQRPLSLYIIPSGAAWENYESYSSVSVTHADARLPYGITLEPDVFRNRFLALNFDKLAIYNATDMSLAGAVNHTLDLSTGSELKIGKNGHVAISDGHGVIHVFNDVNLNNKLFTIDLVSLMSFCFSDNGLLLVNTWKGFSIYDVNTGNRVLSKEWENDTPDPYTSGRLIAGISGDGRFIFVIGKQYNPEKDWADLYELNADFTLSLRQSFPDTKIEQVVFHPLNPRLAIIQYQNGTFGMIDTNGQLLKTVPGKFLNADPFTGNILYKQADYSTPFRVKVLNPDYTRILYQFELPNLGNEEIRLYHNLIFYFMYYAPVEFIRQS